MSTWTRPTLMLAAAALVVAGCAPGASAARDEAAARSAPAPLTPTFAPEDTTAQPAPAPEGTETTEAPAPPPTEEVGSDSQPPATSEPATSEPVPGDREDRAEPRATDTAEPPEPTTPDVSTVADPTGDTSPPVLGDAPAFADLVAGEVRSTTEEVVVTIELAAPPQVERDTTLNVASFHDLSGDGNVDLEVWANHSDGGWYPSWRDNRAGRAAFGTGSGVIARGDGARLTLTFPAELIGDATSWRWALGLEWGRYEWLGTAAAARDVAPDAGLVAHPG